MTSLPLSEFGIVGLELLWKEDPFSQIGTLKMVWGNFHETDVIDSYAGEFEFDKGSQISTSEHGWWMVPREHRPAAGAEQGGMLKIGGMHKGGQNLATNIKVATLQTLLALLDSNFTKAYTWSCKRDCWTTLLQLGCSKAPSF